MAIGTQSDRLMSDINVTPFVDVMLVLLIIFMVTAPMMVQGIDVALPEATSKPLESETEPLIITIDKNRVVIKFEYGYLFAFIFYFNRFSWLSIFIIY